MPGGRDQRPVTQSLTGGASEAGARRERGEARSAEVAPVVESLDPGWVDPCATQGSGGGHVMMPVPATAGNARKRERLP